ncbi:hypothetical protein DMUE_4129 [Dictyocoela muelleri]|nr:hypothetical protein DMUE_4129 [Dictyocoela muelleri]
MQKLTNTLKKHLIDLFEKKKIEISKKITDKQQKIIAQYKILENESLKLREKEKHLDKKFKSMAYENKKMKERINEIKKLLREFINELELDGIDEIKNRFINKIEIMDNENDMEKLVERIFKQD